jgi:hypothetical protein
MGFETREKERGDMEDSREMRGHVPRAWVERISPGGQIGSVRWRGGGDRCHALFFVF